MSQTTPGVVADVMAGHAARGVRLQVWLRVALIAFLYATLLAVPPDKNLAWCVGVAVAYPLAWGAATLWLARMGPVAGNRVAWVPLALDIAALGVVTILAGAAAVESWTAYIVVTGFFLVPVMAATQLHPGVALALAVPTVGVYLFSSITTREANGEPWPSLVLRTVVLVMVCVGSVALSRIQRSRVREIAGLAADRSRLLVELTAIEDRERHRLSEALHDGPLQYVLAARMDLEDARDGDPEAHDRVDQALTESARLLRATVGELHPAVLEHAGLVRAIEDLATGVRERGLGVEVKTHGMPVRPASDSDRVVYAAVRELLTNVVKHADAESVVIELTSAEGLLTAVVTDDGKGFDEERAASRVAEGHIGLYSHRLRVHATGGRFETAAVQPRGTRMTVVVPA